MNLLLINLFTMLIGVIFGVAFAVALVSFFQPVGDPYW